MHYPPYLNPPAEQTGEVANSACGKCKNSVGAPVDAVPTLRINTQPAHPIELENGKHNRARVPLRFGLTSRLQQRVDAPSQYLLPVEVGTFDVLVDLLPRLLEQPVPLRSGDPPRLSHKSETSSVGLPGQDGQATRSVALAPAVERHVRLLGVLPHGAVVACIRQLDHMTGTGYNSHRGLGIHR